MLHGLNLLLSINHRLKPPIMVYPTFIILLLLLFVCVCVCVCVKDNRKMILFQNFVIIGPAKN